ncbi:nucleoside-diphosphate-sugar epimerase [Geodermatophilus bullaregiensis]|uniref:NAD(P)H-binding protein n=1 Tax=Geodermatophilus bullaregiensis TaxID=1564160 RepID=UPI00195B4285|nr:NAD(P)H-binding protein [Geodermatophilus bullaregiensis]MBM7805949.1 nucleoside-diphosphate-sugar epimerase [Geodermatophilus bullaregiensis]
MRVAIAGAHGQIARRLGRLLAGRGDTVLGIVRNPEHAADLESDGVRPVVLDLESASVDEVAEAVRGSDAVVFSAGAGPNSGAERKHTVDRGAAVLLADAAERAGVRPYLLVSSMGVEQARQGTPKGMDPVFAVYLQAKLAAEDRILPRTALDTVIVRPGRLTDEPGTGRVTLAHGVEYGEVPRDDVAAVLLALLDAGKTNEVVELVSGDTPIEAAVAALP